MLETIYNQTRRVLTAANINIILEGQNAAGITATILVGLDLNDPRAVGFQKNRKTYVSTVRVIGLTTESNSVYTTGDSIIEAMENINLGEAQVRYSRLRAVIPFHESNSLQLDIIWEISIHDD